MLLIDRFVTYKEGEERTVRGGGQEPGAVPRLPLQPRHGPGGAGGAGRRPALRRGRRQDVRRAGRQGEAVPAGQAAGRGGAEEAGQARHRRQVRAANTSTASSSSTTTAAAPASWSSRWTTTAASPAPTIPTRTGRNTTCRGKVGTPDYAIHFTVQFPRAEQTFQGFLFTGDGKHIAGTSVMNEREAGFYATREE